MARRIRSIDAFEILDSRGNPTLRVVVELADGSRGVASVPSGASTGRREAVERRDGNPNRYRGRGVLDAVRYITTEIAVALRGLDAKRQEEIDEVLIALDGTPDKSHIGANAIVGVSMAVARAVANALGMPLYKYLGGPDASRLPMPLITVINGGQHADNTLDFQEFLIVPKGASSFADALRYAAETFHALKDILHRRGYSTGVGDEGGFAPNLRSNEEACGLIVDAIRSAGFAPGNDIAIALDPASSTLWNDGAYNLSRSGGGRKDSSEMRELLTRWSGSYPIVSIEDGLGEDDWEGFRQLTAALGSRIQIVGDDIYATNPDLIRRGIEERTTNAALIKLNQIGSVTETIKAIQLCREAGWRYVISHRSGETEDTFIADFAVAMGGGQIKTGSVCRGERVAKYNRLLEIEHELGRAAVFESTFGEPGWQRSRPHTARLSSGPPPVHNETLDKAGDRGPRTRPFALARRERQGKPNALTILALLPEAATTPTCLEAAGAAAAVDPLARITALQVQAMPRHMMTSDEAAALTRAAFDVWGRSVGIPRTRLEWRQRIGVKEPLLDEGTRAADLIVVAQPNKRDGHAALHAAVFDHGHMVLLVPSTWRRGRWPFSAHVAIGWNSCEHVRHAVMRALPWLKVASRVTLMAVDESDVDLRQEEVVRLLHRDGVPLETVPLEPDPGNIGARLLSEARARAADCLLIGAYQHDDQFDAVFGGVTDHVIKHADIPVFLLHWISRHG